MLGGNNSPGIMLLTMNELFRQIERNAGEKDYVIKISYLEVYNETLRDLLSSEDTSLDLREDVEKGIVVAGITEVIATTSQEVMTMLKYSDVFWCILMGNLGLAVKIEQWNQQEQMWFRRDLMQFCR